MTRACGTCTACCVSVGVKDPALKKARCTPCPHLVATGCGIYDTRPGACASFACDWLLGTWGSDDDRPDKSGIIVEDGGERGTALSCAPGFSIDDYGPRLAEEWFLSAGRSNVYCFDDRRFRLTMGGVTRTFDVIERTAEADTIREAS